MKRIIFIVVLLIALGVLVYKYVNPGLVSAGQMNNPNFVSKEELSNVVQSNIDIIWTEIESMKGQISSNDNELTQINQRLDKIEADLSEIKTMVQN